jgi:hypothetical protein
MKHKHLLTSSLISCALLYSQVIGQPKDAHQSKVEMTDSQTVPFVTRGEIDFKGSYGEVRIEGWDRPEVAVTLTRSLRSNDSPTDRAKKRERLNEVKVTAIRQSPDRLAISSRVPSLWFHSSMQLTYELKVPRESDLHIKFGAGEINCSNVVGELYITEHAGEISVALPEGEYAIDARARIGDVTSQFPVKARRPHLIGATATGAKAVESPSVYIRVGVGQINVTKTPPKTLGS